MFLSLVRVKLLGGVVGVISEQLARLERLPVVSREGVHFGGEVGSSVTVHEPERTPIKWWETQTEYSAHIALQLGKQEKNHNVTMEDR